MSAVENGLQPRQAQLTDSPGFKPLQFKKCAQRPAGQEFAGQPPQLGLRYVLGMWDTSLDCATGVHGMYGCMMYINTI